MKKLMLLSVAVLALAGVGVASSVATAGNGAQVLTMANTPIPAYPLVGPGYEFSFVDGSGNGIVVSPTSYQEVVTPSLNSNEVFKGTVANTTGQAVVYTANSGPYPAGSTCHSFATNNVTTDWQATISASGNFTLTCHFGA